MNKTVVLQELAIVVAAKNHNSTILTQDFLKYSGIVRTEWELARPPVYTNRVAQVTFTNGISIVAEQNRVIFLEVIEGKPVTKIEVPGIASKYVQTLPNLEYQAVGINPRGYVSFNNEQDAARKYLAQTLLSPGLWHEVGTEPVRTTLNFTYTLERGLFNLTVSSAALRQKDETTTPIVLFSGNFSYEIANNSRSERLKSLHQIMENWQADLETYKDIINTKFLTKTAENKGVVPDLFAISASASA